MPARWYIEENDSVAMLAAKRLSGGVPEMESQGICLPPSSINKIACSVFETQRRCHHKSKTGVPVAPQKGIMSSKMFLLCHPVIVIQVR